LPPHYWSRSVSGAGHDKSSDPQACRDAHPVSLHPIRALANKIANLVRARGSVMATVPGGGGAPCIVARTSSDGSSPARGSGSAVGRVEPGPAASRSAERSSQDSLVNCEAQRVGRELDSEIFSGFARPILRVPGTPRPFSAGDVLRVLDCFDPGSCWGARL
jgi:hypothetical protein